MVSRSIFLPSAYGKKIEATTKPQRNYACYDYFFNSGTQISLYLGQDLFIETQSALSHIS